MTSRYVDGYAKAMQEVKKIMLEIELSDKDKDYAWRWLRLGVLMGTHEMPVEPDSKIKSVKLSTGVEVEVETLWWILQVPDGKLDISKPLGKTLILHKSKHRVDIEGDIAIGNRIKFWSYSATVVYVKEKVIYVNDVRKEVL